MEIGDWMYFENMGAYTLAAASTFNGFMRPRIHYIIGESHYLSIRHKYNHVKEMRNSFSEIHLFEEKKGNIKSADNNMLLM